MEEKKKEVLVALVILIIMTAWTICYQDPNLKLSKTRRVLIFLIGVVESTLFAGVIFGWPQLVHVLKVEGIYRDLCPGPAAAPAQLEIINQHHNEVSSTLVATVTHTHNNTRYLGLNHTFEVNRSEAVSSI